MSDVFRRADGKRRPEVGSAGPYGKTMLPVGSERGGKDGIPLVKVRMWPDVPGSKDNWVPKTRAVWEREHGERVPDGHVVMFRDHDRSNYDPDNLVCVPRGLMQCMNSLVARGVVPTWSDAESFEAVRLLAEVEMARVRAEARTSRTCRVCGRRFVPDLDDRGHALNRKTCRACLDAGHKGSDGFGTATCPVCGREFKRRGGFHVYCSAKCKRAAGRSGEGRSHGA